MTKNSSAGNAHTAHEDGSAHGIVGNSQKEEKHVMTSQMKDQEERLFERLQYSLWIETELGTRMEDAFQDDEHLVLGGGAVGGKLVVYVNDSPLRLHCRGSSVFPIFDLLGPGKNRIRVEGKHPERMFMKVVAVDPKQFKTTLELKAVLAKTWLDSRSESVTLEFDPKLTKTPDYEELPSGSKPSDPSYQELRRLMDHWAACCNKHDAKALFDSTMPELKSTPPYLEDRYAHKRHPSSLEDVINKRKYRLTTKATEVQFVFGKRSVLVYTGLTDDPPFPIPYLFEFKSDEKGLEPVVVEAMTLARLEGKWVGIR
jgi:hypothetical protein